MAKYDETLFGERVDRDLKKAFGDKVQIFNIQQVGKIGDPDRLICLKGIFLAIELKKEGGKPDTIQIVKLLKVRAAEGIAILSTPSSWPDDLKFIKQVFASL